jgi:5'-methylthioadenosine phosphorylase
MTVGVILGSAFVEPEIGGRALEPVEVRTRLGRALLHRYPREDGDAYVVFRHGVPHGLLPNQVPYRANALALREVGCEALLVTSSVGVLDRSLPLDAPIPLADILMPENRLPDGSACTVFPEPVADQWHLVLDEGLISDALTTQVERLCLAQGLVPSPRAVFAYTPGPRNKTAAENVLWSRLGAQIDSMTVGPEVGLANELGMPCAAVGVGHKYSGPGEHDRLDREAMAESLEVGRRALEMLVEAFLERGVAVPFGNRFYRYPEIRS